MFVREKIHKTKKGEIPYSYLVDNVWNPLKKKYKQIVIYALGRTEELILNSRIEKIITALDNYASKKGFASLSEGVVLKNLSSEEILSSSFDFGEVILTDHLLRQLSFDQIFKNIHQGWHNKNISWEKLLQAIISLIAYHLRPQASISELSTSNWHRNKLFIKNKLSLTKDDFYRTLDFLIDNKNEIENQYLVKNENLFSQPFDLVLFDTTSILYFGAEHPYKKNKMADILKHGFSKDGRGDLKQIIVGILMTEDGKPFAHEVFPGNQSDLVSFSQIIKMVKDKYQLRRVILVADRGMVSELNLKILEEEGLEYILGVKMRKLSPQLKDYLFPADTDLMEKSAANLYVKEFSLSSLTGKLQDEFIKEFYSSHPYLKGENKDKLKERIFSRRYLLCFNPYEAAIKEKKREYFKRIIEKNIQTKTDKEWFVKNGYKKYLKVDELKLHLDEKKLKEEELYDGCWILLTNIKKEVASSSFCGLAYKSLQFVERGFRDLKSNLSVQPVYHSKEERIKAHVFICFLTLIVKWYILKTLNLASDEEGLRFIDNLLNLKAIEVDKSLSLYVRTAIDEKTQQQIKLLKMRIPGKVITDGRKKPASPPKGRGRPRKLPKDQPFLI